MDTDPYMYGYCPPMGPYGHTISMDLPVDPLWTPFGSPYMYEPPKDPQMIPNLFNGPPMEP